MYDSNVFAVFKAYDGRNMASSAFRLSHNSLWFRKAEGGVAEEPTIDSRDPTPAPGAPDDDAQPKVMSDATDRSSGAGTVDRLVVTFDQLHERFHNGIQLGTDPKLSHILLGHRGTKGISRKQCNIVVDHRLRVWLRDYHSSHGTAVGHDSQNEKEVRRRETWILAYEPGPSDACQFGSTRIQAGDFGMDLIFPNHTAGHPDYVKHLQAFADRCAWASKASGEVTALAGLGLDSGPATQAATEAPSPGERLIYYSGRSIGKGAFGEVHMAFRARDGLVCAAKTFKPLPKKRKHEEELPAWLMRIRREFTLMRDNPHPNVARVFQLREGPIPTIYMKYYPHGNMADALIPDEAQRMSGFGQLLEALGHLHEKGVVHRDLKPENFLVEFEPFFKVVIADFGLAKIVPDDAWLKTFCGSLAYMAPEVFPGLSDGHGTLADVWSLGVIGTEWIYNIPEPPPVPAPKHGQVVAPRVWRKWIDTWATELRRVLRDADEGGDQMVGILRHMVEFEMRKRWPAKKCLVRGLEAGLFKRRMADGLIICANYEEECPEFSTKTPTPASPSPRAPRRQLGNDPNATVIVDKLWDGAE